APVEQQQHRRIVFKAPGLQDGQDGQAAAVSQSTTSVRLSCSSRGPPQPGGHSEEHRRPPSTRHHMSTRRAGQDGPGTAGGPRRPGHVDQPSGLGPRPLQAAALPTPHTQERSPGPGNDAGDRCQEAAPSPAPLQSPVDG
ncbi:hypothetical protein CRUP_017903, partial [Coryphaenoides rupestris]